MTRRTSRRHTSRRRMSRNLRRNTSSALANTFFTVFAGILTQEDQKMMARETKRGGRGNIYRLGHYLKALRNIEESARVSEDGVSTAIQIRAAIDVNFTSGNPGDKLRKVVDAYLEHGTLPKYPVQKSTLRRNSKKPRNPYSGMEPMSRVVKAAATARSPYFGLPTAAKKAAIADAKARRDEVAAARYVGGCAYCVSPPGRHKWWCKKLAKNGRPLQVGDVVTLPAGHQVGMGRLKTAVQATVYHIQEQEDGRGSLMYGVEWEDFKTGRLRGTWITAAEVKP